MLDHWYEHILSANANEAQTKHRVMDCTISFAVIDYGTTSNTRKYGNGLKLTGQPSKNSLSC